MATSRPALSTHRAADRQSPQSRKRPVGFRTYGTVELCKLLPTITQRQLQWWDENKVVMPRHDGHRRVYMFEEAMAVAVIAELRRRDLSLQKIRKVLRFLQREIGQRMAEARAHDSKLYLLTDGRSGVIEMNTDRLIDLLAATRHPLHVINLSQLAMILR